jgi:hypothetical protein
MTMLVKRIADAFAASMFVGQRPDKWAAVGAYVAATATIAASVIILLATHQ